MRLKSCPFCGEKAELKEYNQSVDGRGDKLPYVHCTSCSAYVDYRYSDLDNLKKRFDYKGGYLSENKELWDAMHNEIADKWNSRK